MVMFVKDDHICQRWSYIEKHLDGNATAHSSERTSVMLESVV